jgi:hypothetical protein
MLADDVVDVHRQVLQPKPQVPVQVWGRQTVGKADEEVERDRKHSSAAASAAPGVRDVTPGTVAFSGDLRPGRGVAAEAAGVLEAASLFLDLGSSSCLPSLWFWPSSC